MITNREFIAKVVDSYSDTVLRIAYQHTGNIHDSEDIVQEVMLSLLNKNLSDYDDEHLKAYIIRSAVNHCHSFHRKRKRENTVYFEEIYKNGNEPVFTAEERYVLYEVKKLPPKYRDVILLHYYEGYHVKEIADILGLPAGTITSQLKRAREKLKILLKEDNDG